MDKLPEWLKSLVSSDGWVDYCDNMFSGIDDDGNGVNHNDLNTISPLGEIIVSSRDLNMIS